MVVEIKPVPRSRLSGLLHALFGEAWRLQRRRRARYALLLLVVGAAAAVLALKAAGSGAPGDRTPLSNPRVTFSHGTFTIAGHTINIFTGLGLDAPNASENLYWTTGYRGIGGTNYDPDSGARILTIASGSPVAANLSGQLEVAVVSAQITAVRAGRFGTLTAHHLATLPYGEKAIALYIPGTRPAPLRLAGRNAAAQHRLIQQWIHEQRAHQPPMPTLVPLTASGTPAQVSTVPNFFSLPSAYWHAPARPSARARCAVSSTAQGLTTSWGDVATAIEPDTKATPGALLSCLITWYSWHGSALGAAILLDARTPGAPPANIPNFTPLNAHRSIEQSAPQPHINGELATRIGNAWLVVLGGHDTTQRLQFLHSLKISRLNTHR